MEVPYIRKSSNKSQFTIEMSPLCYFSREPYARRPLPKYIAQPFPFKCLGLSYNYPFFNCQQSVNVLNNDGGALTRTVPTLDAYSQIAF